MGILLGGVVVGVKDILPWSRMVVAYCPTHLSLKLQPSLFIGFPLGM